MSLPSTPAQLRAAHKRSLSEDESPAPANLPSQKRAKGRQQGTHTTPKKEAAPKNANPNREKKLALLESFTRSPFAGFARPTPAECQIVHDLLSTVHGTPVRPVELIDNLSGPAGCGEVPNVLDALVRTILSQSTTSANATAAKRAMDIEYGRADYRAVLEKGLDKLKSTIRCGGLGNLKGKAIWSVITTLDEKEGGKGTLSLDYLHELGDKEALAELVSFDGVGVKTASCVLLFCLKRGSFAVDTHVFRISKSLGWLPANATRDTAFQHLDLLIPTPLKYGLHSLFVKHGRGCVKCSSNGVTTMNFVESCPINGIVRREPSKKGKGVPKGKAKKEELDEEDLREEAKQEEEDAKPAVAAAGPVSASSRSRRRGFSVVIPARRSTRVLAPVLAEGGMHGLDG